MVGDDAVAFLRAATPGIRVVVRYHDGDGATDALGELVSIDHVACVIATKRGESRVPFDLVIAAKSVPAAPAPRARRAAGVD
jgi:hypothetical protein